MDKIDLPKVFRSAMVGMGLGALVGLGSTLMKGSKSPTPVDTQQQDLHERIINLKHAPDAEEAIGRMADYKALDPEAYKQLRINMDRIIGLYILVHSKEPANLSYELKITRYRMNMVEALERLSGKYHQRQPSQQFLADAEGLTKIVNNYLFNIKQQMREKIASRQINPV
jgi:hypothetical protein